MKVGIVLCTTNEEKMAKKLAKLLLERELCACVNILPKMKSMYRWQDKICEDKEFLMVIKTREDLFEPLKKTILKYHNYELPEIIYLPVTQGHIEYLTWIVDETRQ